jgi:hypothetical protein
VIFYGSWGLRAIVSSQFFRLYYSMGLLGVTSNLKMRSASRPQAGIRNAVCGRAEENMGLFIHQQIIHSKIPDVEKSAWPKFS